MSVAGEVLAAQWERPRDTGLIGGMSGRGNTASSIPARVVLGSHRPLAEHKPLKIDKSLVKSFPLFERMEDSDTDALLTHATSRRVPVGEAVFEQGAAATHFYLLLHGRLKVTQVTEDGQQIIVRVVHPGDLFGFAKALQRMDYPGTAMAVAKASRFAGRPSSGPSSSIAIPALRSRRCRRSGSAWKKPMPGSAKCRRRRSSSVSPMPCCG